MQDSMVELWKTSHFSGVNFAYIEAQYEEYLKNPNEVPQSLRDMFDQLPHSGQAAGQDLALSTIRDHFLLLAKNKRRAQPASMSAVSNDHEQKQVKVVQMINAFRLRGHQNAALDPLGIMQRENVPDLDLSFYGLSAADLDTVFQTGTLCMGKSEAPLKEILETLKSTYCDSVGVEYMHIMDTKERQWIQQRIEPVKGHPDYSQDVKLHLLERLTASEGLEKYLGSKYPGTKRFGLEGGESLIPLVDELIQRGGSKGSKEVVIAMAHRGRLNMLINILGKEPAELFAEFDGTATYEMGSGDVKYHQGFSSNVMTSGGEVHLAMAFNPSHLEIVSPVLEGSVRARQDRRDDKVGTTVLPICIHGDAAFAGQGVVMETFQMSQTRGYYTGGSVHIIVNNQVGFTTNKQEDARSTEYCTDVAKIIEAPVFHVNADDPEAVLFVTQLALDYRYEFKKDVVIDLVCYRRRGHNEADEPAITQPLMYQVIRKLKSTRTLYSDNLVSGGLISQKDSDDMAEEYRETLISGQHVVKSLVKEPNRSMFVDWSPYLGHDWDAPGDTSYDIEKFQALAAKLHDLPDGVSLHRQVTKIIDDRKKMGSGASLVNWGFAETMAYATLLEQGHGVRLTGQDVGRGTFSHRHAVFHNQKDGSSYIPLKERTEGGSGFDIYDSFLSEEAVLAFEYGYSTTNPEKLVIWEAQFGDFANGAQVVIDQFITSGQHKWGRLSGLTMLLPHGYEGQGPEHSSARLERYLQLCAEHNVQVCMPSTPAQVYHMIRRQAIRPMRRPLIVMSPKSLLRHKLAVSSIDELCKGKFETVIDDHSVDKSKVDKVVLCSGKVYYDLVSAREETGKENVALVRIEQLYPFPEPDLETILKTYPNMARVTWCQEEPQNQGAWYCSLHHMRRVVARVKPEIEVGYAGREASASPAAGYMALHLEQLKAFLEDAIS